MMKDLWLDYNKAIVELFIFVNFSFLIVDISLAHSYNSFAHPAEWIPLLFSILAVLALFPSVVRSFKKQSVYSLLSLGIGGLSILIGISGMILHLGSHFFVKQTLHNLVYTAPFVAPLAYAGLGFLLLLNRMLDANSIAWSKWLVFLALGGFIGNFILAVCDHAQNGFFHKTEWLPVISSAYAIGFLLVVLFVNPSGWFYKCCVSVLILQCIVGVLGVGFHVHGILQSSPVKFADKIRYGTPLFAPLLLPNMSLLAYFGLYDLKMKQLQSN